MTEQIFKKKKLSVKEAVKLLQPFAKNWKRIDEETAEKFHQVYLDCEHGIWKYVLEGLGIPNRTWYFWLEKYNLDVKQPHPEGSHKIAETAISEIDKSVTRDRIPWRWVVKEILPEHKDNKIETPDFPTCGKIGLVWNDFVPSFFLFLSAYTVE